MTGELSYIYTKVWRPPKNGGCKHENRSRLDQIELTRSKFERIGTIFWISSKVNRFQYIDLGFNTVYEAFHYFISWQTVFDVVCDYKVLHMLEIDGGMRFTALFIVHISLFLSNESYIR